MKPPAEEDKLKPGDRVRFKHPEAQTCAVRIVKEVSPCGRWFLYDDMTTWSKAINYAKIPEGEA
jgi:hypothetical protein